MSPVVSVVEDEYDVKTRTTLGVYNVNTPIGVDGFLPTSAADNVTTDTQIDDNIESETFSQPSVNDTGIANNVPVFKTVKFCMKI